MRVCDYAGALCTRAYTRVRVNVVVVMELNSVLNTCKE